MKGLRQRFGWWLMGLPVDADAPLTHWRWRRYRLGADIYNWRL